MKQIRTNIRRSLQGMYSPGEISALTRIICRDLLQVDEVSLYLDKDINLSDTMQRILDNTVSRLRRNEPIQYICGSTEFLGHSFRVTPAVLIPRPETEELVERILKENPSPGRLLDIGTGSGCIAVSLAVQWPQAEVYAWDISTEALRVAADNAACLGAKVSFSVQDVFGPPVASPVPLDIIVSNPPYIAESEKSTMEPNVLGWEPSQALFVPDTDPLCFYRRIAEIGPSMLVAGGKVYLEINRAYGKETAFLFESFGYHSIRILPDLSGNDRIVTAIWK
ncbi:MAG: peptide chain release factor N(5)-glutamine methyltransferase [Bacteroides sp.]|nr:peptide chain release factor N(5)-glutamine methyltransferase [Bacteroides sp.]